VQRVGQAVDAGGQGVVGVGERRGDEMDRVREVAAQVVGGQELQAR